MYGVVERAKEETGERKRGAGGRKEEAGKRKQEAGTGTPSPVIPARARPHARTYTRTHTTVIPAQAGIQVRSG
jgi:hypothetical protein